MSFEQKVLRFKLLNYPFSEVFSCESIEVWHHQMFSFMSLSYCSHFTGHLMMVVLFQLLRGLESFKDGLLMLHSFNLPFCGPVNVINFLCAKFIYWPIWKFTLINISPLFLFLLAPHGMNNNVSMPKPDFKDQQLCSTNLENGVLHRENWRHSSKGAWAWPEIWNSFLSSNKFFVISHFSKKKNKNLKGYLGFSFICLLGSSFLRPLLDKAVHGKPNFM